MAFIKHVSPRISHGRPAQLSKVSLTITLNGGSKQKSRNPAIQIRITKDLIGALGWIAGDRMDLYLDDEYPLKMMIQRSKDGQFALSPSGGKSDMGKSNVHCNIKCRMPEVLKCKVGDKFFTSEFEIKNGSIFVDFEPLPQ